MTHTKPLFISFLFTIAFSISSIYAQTKTTEEVKSLLEKKIEYNKKNGYGFRIQLDNGLETTIKTTESEFQLIFPEIKTYIVFETPDWKIQIGDYKTRLEADKVLNEVKLKFPLAIIVPR
ncbi:MAG: hypothetical protein P8H13_06860 [Polaribacter sp.]|nr:hypothetical protein [Polaribacter sp.]MDG1811641.1 hypothetical protein [Polaribacter sp.]MDG1993494.1 hypothetical protein [Polaribacter sp.]